MRKRRLLTLCWSCSDTTHHQHRWYLTAWLCGQAAAPARAGARVMGWGRVESLAVRSLRTDDPGKVLHRQGTTVNPPPPGSRSDTHASSPHRCVEDEERRRATELGRRVLRNLADGRERALTAAKARGAMLQNLVCRAAVRDRNAGGGDRGRAKRVQASLQGIVVISERHIRRLLTQSDGLFSVSDRLWQSPPVTRNHRRG